jgi:hypothetical protein
MASIRDWFDNASARERGGFRYDWRDDDPIDRTPDSWLDNLSPAGGRPAPAAPARPAIRNRSASAAPARSSKRNAGPVVRGNGTDQTLAQAIQSLRATFPGIGNKGVVRRLRQSGWTSLSDDALEVLLEAGPPPPPVNSRRSTAQVRRPNAAARPARGRPRFSKVQVKRVPGGISDGRATYLSPQAAAAQVAKQPRAARCPSCEGPISILGTCRCS